MKYYMFIALLLMPAYALVAQKPNPCERLNRNHQWMKDSLGLNATQQQQLSTLNDATCANLRAAKEKAAGNKEVLKKEASAIMKNHRKEMSSVLNKAQKTKLKAHKQSQKAHRAAKHSERKQLPGERAEKRTQIMKDSLGLSPEQALQIQELNHEQARKIMELKTKYRNNQDTAAKHNELRVVQQKYLQQLQLILTKTQWDKFSTMRIEKQAVRKQRARAKTD